MLSTAIYVCSSLPNHPQTPRNVAYSIHNPTLLAQSLRVTTGISTKKFPVSKLLPYYTFLQTKKKEYKCTTHDLLQVF